MNAFTEENKRDNLTSLLGNNVLYGIRMIDRGIPEFKPIGKDEKNRDNIFA
jgi:hypothetical protein